MKKIIVILFLFMLPHFVFGYTSWITKEIETEEGIYSVKANILGKGEVSMLIDGEKYFDPVTLRGSKTILEQNYYLEKGTHTVIFLFNNTEDKEINISFQNSTGPYANTSMQTVVTPYGNIFEVGDFFTGSYINVNIARDYALFSDNFYQYISYYNSDGYLVMGQRKINDSYFKKYFLPVKPVSYFSDSGYFLADPHYFISSYMDNEGHIHVAYGHHNDKLNYLISKNSQDLSEWTTNNIINLTENDRITYPRFFRFGEDFIFMYRNSKEDEASPKITLLKYDAENKTWSKLHETLITAYGTANAYLWRPVIINNTIHLAWTWRLYEFEQQPKQLFLDGLSNKDIMYAKSNDIRKWMNSNNEEYVLPIDRENAEVIQDIDVGEDMFNHFGSDYDSSGHPHFVYTRQYEGIAQQWHIYFDGKEWIDSVVTDYKDDFHWKRWQQGGQSSTYVVRPTVLISKEDEALVFSRTEENNNAIEIYLSEDYDNWRKIVVFNESVGGWEPQLDMDMWHRENKINLLVVGITDEVVYERNLQAEDKIDRLKALIYRTLKYLGLWKPYVNIVKGEEIGNSDFYSPDISVEKKEVSSLLKENIGYIYEIDYEKIK